MDVAARPSLPAPDLSLVPWLLLALLWLAHMAMESAAVVFFADQRGVELLLTGQADLYVMELWKSAAPLPLLGALPWVLFWPQRSWLLCAALLGGCGVGAAWSFSSRVLFSPAGLISIALPVLPYGLALSIAVRHARRLARENTRLGR